MFLKILKFIVFFTCLWYTHLQVTRDTAQLCSTVSVQLTLGSNVNFPDIEYSDRKLYFPGTRSDSIHHFDRQMKASADLTRVHVLLLSTLGLYLSNLYQSDVMHMWRHVQSETEFTCSFTFYQFAISQFRKLANGWVCRRTNSIRTLEAGRACSQQLQLISCWKSNNKKGQTVIRLLILVVHRGWVTVPFWQGWLDLQCCDTVGWVIWTVKWAIMCRVG